MSQTYFTILTNLGAAKLAEATASGAQLKLTHLAVGDGNGNVPSPLPSQTQLIHEVRRSAINTIYTDENNENHIIIEQVIPPEEGGFYIRELGVFDDKGNLIAVGNCPPSYKPKLSEGSGRTQVINMVIMVDNTGTIELKIDASTVLATRKYVDDLISSKMIEHEKSTNHPDASTTGKGFVQLSSAINSTLENQAATPKAVKTAYDLANTANTTANTAKTNAATAQTKADRAYTLASTANTTANTAKSTAETDASTTVKGRVQLNSAVNSTVENQAATPKAVKTAYDLANKSVGIGQKWQNVKASRTTNTVYTNTTGKPIYVYIQVFNDLYLSATECTLILGSGVELDAIGGGVGHSGAWKSANLSVIIPENETYKVITRDGNIKTWAELR